MCKLTHNEHTGTPSWISRRALTTMQKQLGGGGGGGGHRLRRFASSNRHSVGSFFSAMTLMFLLRMSKFSSSFREILLDHENPEINTLTIRRCMEIVLCESTVHNEGQQQSETDDDDEVVLHAGGLIECSEHSRQLATQGQHVSTSNSSDIKLWKPLNLKDLKNLLKLYFQTHDREKLRYVDTMATIHVNHQPLLHLQLLHRHGEPLFDPAPPHTFCESLEE